MKKMIFFSLLTGILTFTGSAQQFKSLDKSPVDIVAYPSKYNVADKAVRVVYSRPQLKGRNVADLAPMGKVWRTGANEAVEITFYKDATIAGKALEAGTYSLFTIPGKEEWTVIINQNLNQWGAYSYDSGADVLRAMAKVDTSGESLEAFSMAFKEADDGLALVMGWDTLRIALPIKI